MVVCEVALSNVMRFQYLRNVRKMQTSQKGSALTQEQDRLWLYQTNMIK